jgi:hypothetical protein
MFMYDVWVRTGCVIKVRRRFWCKFRAVTVPDRKCVHTAIKRNKQGF